MAKKYKKEVLTLEEIGAVILEKTEGRYKNLNSAYTAAKKAANILGIEDINGKKRNKLISAKNADIIVNYVLEPKQKQEKTPVENPNRNDFIPETDITPLHSQVSIFDLIEPLEVPSVSSTEEKETESSKKAEETIKVLDEFKKARAKLEEILGHKLIIYFKDYYI